MNKSIALLMVSLVIWALSCYVLANSGLALVIDEATGEKHCINMLSRFLGVADDSWVLIPVGIATMAGFYLLPLIPLGMLMRWFWDKAVARKQARPCAGGSGQGQTL